MRLEVNIIAVVEVFLSPSVAEDTASGGILLLLKLNDRLSYDFVCRTACSCVQDS